MPVPGFDAVTVRRFATSRELAQCEWLYRRVFGLRPEEGSLNPRLLIALDRNSGIVLGAFARDKLIGFTFSFLARDGNSLYQYSQTAAVLSEWQGEGVGRRLKLAQREAAIERGIHRMRWVFDPFKVRNAHFNLDVLGGVADELARDLYGEYGPGLDAGNSSDRLIVDWRLESDRVRRRADGDRLPVPPGPGEIPSVGTVWRPEEGVAALAVPAVLFPAEGSAARDVPTVRPRAKPCPAVPSLREAILAAIEDLLGEGFVIASCRRLTEDVAAYYFEARDDLFWGEGRR